MSSPAERIWTVNTYLVDEAGGYHEQPQALTTALLECVGIISRLGGVIQMASRRQEIAPGWVVTVAVVFRWRSFVPVDRAQEAPPAEQDGSAVQAEAPPLAQPADLPLADAPPPAAPPAQPAPEPATEPAA